MSPSARRPDPPARPTFVFKGTIRRVGDTTMKDVPADTRTAVVQVDDVIESPKDLTRLAGQDITVQLGGRGNPKAGAQMVFHTIPLMFGESVLVKSLKQEPSTRAGAAMAAGDPVERKAARDLEERAHDADVIVSGRVMSVTLPEDVSPPAGAVSDASKPARIRPISEHDPKWRDAIVEVEAVHKGRPARQTIKVRFPASTDVRWYKAPKFQPGQHGTFVLHKTPTPQAASPARLGASDPGRAARKEEPEVYTALHPADFQPDSEAPAVASMIATAETSKPGSGIRGAGSGRTKTTAKKKTAQPGSGISGARSGRTKTTTKKRTAKASGIRGSGSATLKRKTTKKKTGREGK